MQRNLCKYQNILNINASNDKNPNSVCNFVLHLHDELIYEVNNFCKITRQCVNLGNYNVGYLNKIIGFNGKV